MAMSSSPIEHPPEGKRANRETQAEVDIMILDYLLYMAAKQTIQGRKAERSSLARGGGGGGGGSSSCSSGNGNGNGELGAGSPADATIAMVDCEFAAFPIVLRHGKPVTYANESPLHALAFLPLFKANHPSHPIPEPAQSRLHLLKFTVLFVNRLQRTPSTPSLQSLTQLRAKNHLRAATWLSHHPPTANNDPVFTPFTTSSPQNNLPLPSSILRQNRHHILARHYPSHTHQPHHGTPSSLSLRDTLPQFMELSAYITSIYESGRVNETWEEMAAEYMLQAALEAYLVYGEQGDEPLRECFAWGFDEMDEQGMLVNAMFWDEEGEVMRKWTEIRGEYLRAFIPPSTTPSLQAHLESVAARFPLFRFEGKLLDFLWALSRQDSAPTLVQLESGVLDGFSREETEALSLKVGIQI